MKHAGLALTTFAALVLERAAPFDSPVGPHFLLAAALLAVWGLEGPSAIVWAAIAGLLSDCLSSGPLGISMFCTTAAALGLQALPGFRARWFVAVPAVLAIAPTFFVLCSVAMARAWMDGYGLNLEETLLSASASAALTVLLFGVAAGLLSGMKVMLSRVTARAAFRLHDGRGWARY